MAPSKPESIELNDVFVSRDFDTIKEPETYQKHTILELFISIGICSCLSISPYNYLSVRHFYHYRWKTKVIREICSYLVM